ncbi:MAG: response regulator [Rickettsiales bacterium]|nr:response regulator [Rickettsiales bacterium]
MSINPNISILIVDDYRTMLRIIRNLLSQLGFNNVDEATDGVTALKKIGEKQFDLIISDWNMEPMSGIELLQKVRADETNMSIPFIMVTAENKPENVVKAKEAGVDNYIVKPFNAETLRGKLVSVLSKQAS